MTAWISGFLALSFAAYVALVVLLYRFQRRLIYHPDKRIGSPAQHGLDGFTQHMVRTPDSETIQLWHRAAGEGMPTVVYFHGNAANIGTRAPLLQSLAERGFGVLGVSYRGYGGSTGSPSETGLYNDARAAISFLLQQQHLPVRHIILFGESLGTGVAVQMATEYDVGALVLQAPYTSVAARAAEIHYYIPVQWLIKDVYDSLGKIQQIRAPLLVFHGELDTTIPMAHGRALFEAAYVPKHSVFFNHVGHNDFDSSVISEHVLAFSRTHNML
jgi:pimeloyl-ACP methyl ester carboxylesterase